MSTEEKITENQETTTKPKRRFKVDKKHIQGFIVGILLCAIAFTGLYYGTDGQFFAGSVTRELLVVSDANFEKEVINSDLFVLVVSYIKPDPGVPYPDQLDDQIIDRDNILRARYIASMPEYRGKIKAVKLDVDNSSETIQNYLIKKGPGTLVYRDGECVYETRDVDIFRWVSANCR